VGEGLAGDHLHVVRVGQDDLFKDGQGPLGKLDGVGGQLLELGEVIGFEGFADAAGQAQDGMNDLAAEIGDELAEALAGGDDFLAGFQADLADDADDVALLGGASGPTMKSGPPSTKTCKAWSSSMKVL